MKTSTKTEGGIHAHLMSTCPAVCTDIHCPQMLKQSRFNGRWFITIGHAGFNSKTNNGAGYKNKDTAYQAAYTYLCRSGRTITSTLPKTADLIAWEAKQAAAKKVRYFVDVAAGPSMDFETEAAANDWAAKLKALNVTVTVEAR